MITEALQGVPGISVIGQAGSGREGIRQIEALDPDIVSLDIELGDISGLDVLEHVMRTRPRRVVVVSSQTEAGADTTFRALALGAVDFVAKGRLDPGPDGFEARLRRTFEAARHARVLPSRSRQGDQRRTLTAEQRLERARERRSAAQERRSAATTPARPARPARPVAAARTSVAAPPRPGSGGAGSLRKPGLLLIASSTGGPPALQEFFATLTVKPAMPILLVQHMPEAFTARLASRLDQSGPTTVREATHGEAIQPGVALIAKGGRHLGVDGRTVSLLDTDPVGALKPRADITFQQAVDSFGGNLLAVVLTGMGDDGLIGCQAVARAGGQVLAQSGETSTVDGMPQKVRNAGLHLAEGSPAYLAALIDRLSGGRPSDSGRSS